MENSTEKKGIFFLEIYSFRCLRSSTVDIDIEAESGNKSPNNQKIQKKGNPVYAE
jgi:hypothetical protein